MQPGLLQHLAETHARFGLHNARTSATWTPAEQNAFFRALAVYSRWRPDLIAAAIPTRTTWQIEQYLAALEDGASRIQDGDESLSDSDQHDSDSDIEPAYQVSEAWVAVEEALASHVIEEENAALLERRRGKAPEKRPRGRPRINDGRKGRRPRYRRRGARRFTPDDKEDSSTLKHASPVREDAMAVEETPPEQPRKKRPRVTVAREDYMTHLDDAHLTVLDTFLREGEESIENSRDVVPPETGHTHTDDPSNALIDPALLAMSRVSPIPTATMPSPPIISEHHAGTFTNIGLSHFSYIGPNAPHEGPPGLNPDLLSPKSRRRLQKRLYMRRHRAKLQGHLDSAQSPTATFPGRLKAGRKPKKAPAPSTTCTSDIESDDQQSAKPKQNKSGLTLPYKLRAIFSELGVDAAYLRAQGMDLIHFSALANLRGLYNTLERGPSPNEDEVPKGVDATLVQHLQAAVVVFVTDVMHRAIVWKERQIQLKKHSLAWRTNEYITANAVKHALETLGVRYHSHKDYFSALLSRSTAPPSDHDTNESSPIEGSAREHEDPTTSALPAHRDIYTPLVRPPSVLGIHPLDCFARTYMREATRRADTRVERDQDDQASLMSDETDEEALEAELQEDEALDEEDAERAEKYEEDLWAQVFDSGSVRR